MSDYYSDKQKKYNKPGGYAPRNQPYSSNSSYPGKRTDDRYQYEGAYSNKSQGGYNYQDSYYDKGGKYDNFSTYKYKGPPRARNNVDDRESNVWKKKTTRIAKEDILSLYPSMIPFKELWELSDQYPEVFQKNKITPVNDDVFQLDSNDGFVPKNYNREGGNHDQRDQGQGNKQLELYDLGQTKFDPIQAMRQKQKQAGGKNESEDEMGSDDEDRYQRRSVDEDTHSKRNEDEDGAEHYSDIDEKFERKLKNNEYRPEEDIFEELVGGTKKGGQNAREMGLEDDERPVWEDVDTGKIIEDIKNRKIDFLSNLPQEKDTIFGGDKPEPVQIQVPKTLSRFLQQSTQPQPQPLQPEPKQEENKETFEDLGGVDFAKLLDMEAGPTNPLQSDDFFSQQAELFKAAVTQFTTQKPTEQAGSDGNNINNFINTLNMGAPNGNKAGDQQNNQYFQQQPNMQQNPNIQQQNNFQQQRHQQNFQQHPNYNPHHQQQQQQQMMMQQMQQQQGFGPGGYRGPNQNQNPNMQGPQPNSQQPQQIGQPFQKFKRNPCYPSFIFKYYSMEYEAETWFYLDKNKKQQGPFTGELMDKWYEEGLLPMELMVTIGKENNEYKSIKELAEFIVYRTINGDGPAPPKKTPTSSLVSELVKSKPELMSNSTEPNLPVQARTLEEIEMERIQAEMRMKQQQMYRRNQENYRHGGKRYNNNNMKNQNRNNMQYNKGPMQVQPPETIIHQVDGGAPVEDQLKSVLGLFNKPMEPETEVKVTQPPEIVEVEFPAISQ